MRNQKLSAALGAFAALTAAVFLLLLLVCGLGSSSTVMLRLMRDTAPPETTGLPADAYEPAVQMITSYLKGHTEEFQLTLTAADGTQLRLFNEKEQRHMTDCKALFVLGRRVCCACAVLLAVLVLTVWRWGNPRVAIKGAAFSLAAVLIAAVVLAAAACVSFDTLFIRFHQLFFTNDLWLMNWNTDLIVRLMPTGFFVRYAAMIGGGWIIGGCLALVVTRKCMRNS